ncbi:RNA-binding protein [Clostridia bacterium]|nr:RNA-binding protein [Clostridia bacterium]
MDSKQRAELRAKANGIETVLTVGKSGITEQLIGSAEAVITARELIKGRALETCPLPPKECAAALSERLNADVIQVVGSRFVLYRLNPKLHEQKKAPSTGHVYGRQKVKPKSEVPREKKIYRVVRRHV